MRWRKMTWAIVIWTALMALWIIGGLSAASDSPDAGSTAYRVGAGIGVTLLFGIWFVGFLVLALIWLMSRPKQNVTVYGPAGQQVMVSESEARKRVERQGWAYQPGIATPPRTPIPGDFDFAEEAKRPRAPE